MTFDTPEQAAAYITKRMREVHSADEQAELFRHVKTVSGCEDLDDYEMCKDADGTWSLYVRVPPLSSAQLIELANRLQAGETPVTLQ